MRHGGQILVDALRANGVGRVFSVPGESFLAVLDGLYTSGIRNVVCRHEGAAAMMAAIASSSAATKRIWLRRPASSPRRLAKVTAATAAPAQMAGGGPEGQTALA